MHDNEFGLTTDDLPTIQSYVAELIDALSVEKESQDSSKGVVPQSSMNAIIHEATEEPPADFCKNGNAIGPVIGTRTALGFSLHNVNTLTKQQYRKHFESKFKTESIWVRKGTHGREVEIFVKSFGTRHRCELRLKLFPNRVQSETKGN